MRRLDSILSRMIETQQLDKLVFDSINNHVRKWSQKQLPSALNGAKFSLERMAGQGHSRGMKPTDGRRAIRRMVGAEIGIDIFEICGSRRCPAKPHLGLEHSVYARFHLRFFYKLAALGLSQGLFNGGAKPLIRAQ